MFIVGAGLKSAPAYVRPRPGRFKMFLFSHFGRTKVRPYVDVIKKLPKA
jgi:hypothetical protein